MELTFGSIEVIYDEEVLTPRLWTVAQSQWAIELLADEPAGAILELCSGAGHIGRLVAAETGRVLVQVDSSRKACELARRNAMAGTVAVDVREMDLDSQGLRGENYALVLADPPYIPTFDINRFPDDPRMAIDGGCDGLAVARRCWAVADACLVAGGLFLIQLWNLEQVGSLTAEVGASTRLVVEDCRSVGGHGALLLARAIRC